MIKKILQNKGGFSLLEMLITIGIIALMVSIFLTNYRSGSRSTDLTFSAQQLVSDARLAQNNAIGSVNYAGVPSAGGWGVHFDKTSGNNLRYFIFADLNNNKLYDSSPDEALVASGGRVISLPKNVTIESLNDGVNPRNQLDVTFLPPDPVTRIYWNGSAVSTTKAIIGLKESISGKTKNVDINILGLIEVE